MKPDDVKIIQIAVKENSYGKLEDVIGLGHDGHLYEFKHSCGHPYANLGDEYSRAAPEKPAVYWQKII